MYKTLDLMSTPNAGRNNYNNPFTQKNPRDRKRLNAKIQDLELLSESPI